MRLTLTASQRYLMADVSQENMFYFSSAKLTPRHAFFLFAVVELIYIGAARLLLFNYKGTFISMELWWTALRLVSLFALISLFRSLIWRAADYVRFPLLLIPLSAAFLLIPVLVGHFGLSAPAKYIFAATSLVVGFREEIAYRGVLQRLLFDRYGLLVAILASNLLFVFYHFGVWPITVWHVFQWFAAGTVFGLLYHITGSIALVALLHAGYDAIGALTPLIAFPAPEWVAMIIFTGIIILLTKIWLTGRCS